MTSDRDGKQLVIAFFDDAATGQAAARSLEQRALTAGRGGTVGMLLLDRRGRISTAWLGSPVADDGPGIGAVLGVIAVALTAPAKLPSRPLSGDIAGLPADDIARFAAEMDAGQAAVAVLDDADAAEVAVVELARLGGKTELHWLTSPQLAEATAATTGQRAPAEGTRPRGLPGPG